MPRLQLVAYGYAGTPSPEAFTYEAPLSQLWKDAQKRAGGVSNVVALRDEGESGLALVLAHSWEWPSTWNQKNAWSPGSAGAGDGFEEGLTPFPGDATALGYTNSTANASASFTSGPTAPVVQENTPFALRRRLFSPNEGQAGARFGARWDNFFFDVFSDRAELFVARDAAAATSFASNGPADGDLLKLELNALGGDVFNPSGHHVSFWPEGQGLITLQSLNGDTKTLPLDDKLARNAQDGTLHTLWPDASLSLDTLGGEFYWQAGHPSFEESGEMLLGPFAGNADSLADLSIVARAYKPAGTNITYAVEPHAIGREFSVRVTLSTTNPRLTPYLYTIVITRLAGVRDGDRSEAWNSDDHRATEGLFEDVSLCYEGDMRRRSVQMTIANPNGKTFEAIAQGIHATLENRLGSFLVDGKPIVTRGLFPEANLDNMTGAAGNQPMSFICGVHSSVTVELCDRKALLDEQLMRDLTPGDRMFLGDYLKQSLLNAGEHPADIDIALGLGRQLPGARLGESDLIVPQARMSRAAWYQQLCDEWGMGMRLYLNSLGRWTFGLPDRTIKARFGPRESGRRLVIEPLQLVRDFADFYNWFEVCGKDGKFPKVWPIWESIKKLSVFTDYTFIGRKKEYPLVQRDSIRTDEDANWVIRSLVTVYGQPGRFQQFAPPLDLDLFPGDSIAFDDVPAEIKRIPSASVDNDEMVIVTRELVRGRAAA